MNANEPQERERDKGEKESTGRKREERDRGEREGGREREKERPGS